MANERIKRKISAILISDVVGYSRLMEDDEESTIRTLEAYRETITNLIQQHNGRVVDFPAEDNSLSEFASVVDAVQCAVEIQHVIKAKNAVLPETRRMEFRIGINLGDVIEEEDRIYGDGVNIAARIEGIADAGGICISESVYQQIKSKLALGYEDLGEHSVKNITEPVRVYRIPMDSGIVRDAGIKKTGLKRFQWVALILIALIFGAVVFVVWDRYLKTPPPSEIAVPLKASTPAEKPSIAVLPFENMSDDPEQEYFSNGITEEIINGLANNPGLIVKARASSSSEKIKNQDVKTIAELLKVTHVVEGSVRKSGNHIRLTVQLIKTDEDSHIWSKRYDRVLTDVFEVQDEITGEILKALNIHLVGSSQKQIRTTNMEAYNAYLLGNYYIDRWELDKALIEAEKAISLDSEYADAYVLLGAIHNCYLWLELYPTREKWPIVRKYADKALSLAHNVSLKERHKKYVLDDTDHRFIAEHSYQKVLNELINLVWQYPDDTFLLLLTGSYLGSIGCFDEAFHILEQTEKIDPLYPTLYSNRGLIFYLAKRYDKARENFEKAEMLGTKNVTNYLFNVAMSTGDEKALQNLLDRGESNWTDIKKYAICKAAVSYLKGDQNRVKEILAPLWHTSEYIPFRMKSQMALLEGALDLALDYYERAITEPEYMAFWVNKNPFWGSKIFPDYRSHPKWQKMLQDVGLDDESIAKLKIPPLPF